jgi:hypothetical protein
VVINGGEGLCVRARVHANGHTPHVRASRHLDDAHNHTTYDQRHGTSCHRVRWPGLSRVSEKCGLWACNY